MHVLCIKIAKCIDKEKGKLVPFPTSMGNKTKSLNMVTREKFYSSEVYFSSSSFHLLFHPFLAQVSTFSLPRRARVFLPSHAECQHTCITHGPHLASCRHAVVCWCRRTDLKRGRLNLSDWSGTAALISSRHPKLCQGLPLHYFPQISKTCKIWILRTRRGLMLYKV